MPFPVTVFPFPFEQRQYLASHAGASSSSTPFSVTEIGVLDKGQMPVSIKNPRNPCVGRAGSATAFTDGQLPLGPRSVAVPVSKAAIQPLEPMPAGLGASTSSSDAAAAPPPTPRSRAP